MAESDGFTEFLDLCKDCLGDSKKELVKLIKKRYREADDDYIESEDFASLLQTTRDGIINNKKRLFVHLKSFLDTLKRHKGSDRPKVDTSDNEHGAPPSKRAKLYHSDDCSGVESGDTYGGNFRTDEDSEPGSSVSESENESEVKSCDTTTEYIDAQSSESSSVNTDTADAIKDSDNATKHGKENLVNKISEYSWLDVQFDSDSGSLDLPPFDCGGPSSNVIEIHDSQKAEEPAQDKKKTFEENSQEEDDEVLFASGPLTDGKENQIESEDSEPEEPIEDETENKTEYFQEVPEVNEEATDETSKEKFDENEDDDEGEDDVITLDDEELVEEDVEMEDKDEDVEMIETDVSEELKEPDRDELKSVKRINVKNEKLEPKQGFESVEKDIRMDTESSGESDYMITEEIIENISNVATDQVKPSVSKKRKHESSSSSDGSSDSEHNRKVRERCRKKGVISVGKKTKNINKISTQGLGPSRSRYDSGTEKLSHFDDKVIKKFGHSPKKKSPKKKSPVRGSPIKSNDIVIITDSESSSECDLSKETFYKKVDEKYGTGSHLVLKENHSKFTDIRKKKRKESGERNKSPSHRNVSPRRVSPKSSENDKFLELKIELDRVDQPAKPHVKTSADGVKKRAVLTAVHDDEKTAVKAPKAFQEKKVLSETSKSGSSGDTPVAGSSGEAGGDGTSKMEDPEDPAKKKASSRQIRRLEKLLQDLRNKIEEVRNRELDLNALDSDVSDYLLEDKLQVKFMKVWDKLCELHKASKITGRQSERYFRYQGTRYPVINRKIEKLINKRKVFPDYNDVHGIIAAVNKDKRLHLRVRDIDTLAREAFTDVGNRLQERRQKELVAVLKGGGVNLYNSYDDPALYDQELKKKLEANRKTGKTNMDQVVEKYSHLQMEEGDKTDEDDDEEEEEEEEAEKENDLEIDAIISNSMVDNSDSEKDEVDIPCLEIENIESGSNTKLNLHEPGDVERLQRFKGAKTEEESEEQSFAAMLGLKSVEKKEEAVEQAVKDESGMDDVAGMSRDSDTSEPVMIEIDEDEIPEVNETDPLTVNINDTSKVNQTEQVNVNNEEPLTIEIEDVVEMPVKAKTETLTEKKPEPVTIEIDIDDYVETPAISKAEQVKVNKNEPVAIEIDDNVETPALGKAEPVTVNKTEPLTIEIDDNVETPALGKAEPVTVNKTELLTIEIDDNVETPALGKAEPVTVDKTEPLKIEDRVVKPHDSIEINSIPTKPSKFPDKSNTPVEKQTCDIADNDDDIIIIGESKSDKIGKELLKTEHKQVRKDIDKDKFTANGINLLKGKQNAVNNHVRTETGAQHKKSFKMEWHTERSVQNVPEVGKKKIVKSKGDMVKEDQVCIIDLCDEPSSLETDTQKENIPADPVVKKQTQDTFPTKRVHLEHIDSSGVTVTSTNLLVAVKSGDVTSEAADGAIEPCSTSKATVEPVCADENSRTSAESEESDILIPLVTRKDSTVNDEVTRKDPVINEEVSDIDEIEDDEIDSDLLESDILVPLVTRKDPIVNDKDEVTRKDLSVNQQVSRKDPRPIINDEVSDISSIEDGKVDDNLLESDLHVPLVKGTDPIFNDEDEVTRKVPVINNDVSDLTEIEDDEIDSNLLDEMLAVPEKESEVVELTSSGISDEDTDDRSKQCSGMPVISKVQGNVETSIPENNANCANSLCNDSRPTVDSKLEMLNSLERTLVSDSKEIDEELVFEKVDDLVTEVESGTYGSSMSDIFRDDTPIDEAYNLPTGSGNHSKDNEESVTAVTEPLDGACGAGRKAKHKHFDTDSENDGKDVHQTVTPANESSDESDNVKQNLPDTIKPAVKQADTVKQADLPADFIDTSESDQDNTIVEEASDNELEITSTYGFISSHHISNVFEKLKNPAVKNNLIKLEKASNLKKVKVYPVVKQKAKTAPLWLEDDENADLIENYVEPDSSVYSQEEIVTSSHQEDVIVLSDSE